MLPKVFSALLLAVVFECSAVASSAPDIAFSQAFHGREYEIISQGPAADGRELGKLDILLFTEGRPSSQFTHLGEGAVGNVHVLENVNIHVKATTSHIYSRDARVNLLDPNEEASARHRFTRLGSSVEFLLPSDFKLEIGASQDIAGSHANILEAALSKWVLTSQPHPLHLGVGTARDDSTLIRLHTLNVDLKLAEYKGMNWFLISRGQLYADGPLTSMKEGRVSGGIMAAQTSKGFGFKIGGGGGARGPFADLGLFYLFEL